MQSSQPEYKRYLSLLKRRKELFVLLSLCLMTVVFAASYLLPRKYESSSTVFIEKNVISELVKGLTVTPSMEDTISVLTYAITSRSLLAKVVDNLDMNLSKNEGANEELIKSLQKNISVKVKEKNNLFTISFVHQNPRIARDFVNTLVRLYIEENVSSKRGESYDATKFLSEQITTFNSKLEKAEAEVNAYKRDKGGIIALDEGKLFQEIGVAQQKLYDLELRRRQLEGMRQVTRKSNDPLEAKLSALQKRLSDLRVEYTDGFPEVISVKSDIQTVKEQLKSRKSGDFQSLDPQEIAKIESEISAIKVSEEGLRRYVATNKKLLEGIPSAKAGLEKLELEQKNQKNLYDQLVSRHGQSEVSKQMEVQDKTTTFRIVDPAVLPVKPASPNRLMIMLAGILGGVAGSFALLVFLDQMDPSVKEVEAIKGLGAPVLAMVPRIQNPVEEARRRRKALKIYAAATVYFAAMLIFPAMELLGLPYMDKVLDTIYPTSISHSVSGLLR